MTHQMPWSCGAEGVRPALSVIACTCANMVRQARARRSAMLGAMEPGSLLVRIRLAAAEVPCIVARFRGVEKQA